VLHGERKVKEKKTVTEPLNMMKKIIRRLGENFYQHVVQIQRNIPLVASINN